MNTQTRMWGATLLALSAAAHAQERAVAIPAPIATTDAPALSSAAKPAFDLRNASVQDVIRATAAAQPQSEEEPTAADSELEPLPFRAPRRLHHMDCDSFNCVAYTADDVALYTIPRDQTSSVRASGDNPREEWQSCQSGNDLLTTFERYDKCRGVTIGLPLQMHDVLVDLPKLRLF